MTDRAWAEEYDVVSTTATGGGGLCDELSAKARHVGFEGLMWNGEQPRPRTRTVRASVFDGRPRDGVLDGEVIAIVNAVRRGGEVPERQELSALRAPEASRGETGSGL